MSPNDIHRFCKHLPKSDAINSVTLVPFLELGISPSFLLCARKFPSLVWPTVLGRAECAHFSSIPWRRNNPSQHHWHFYFPFSTVSLPEQAHWAPCWIGLPGAHARVQSGQHTANTTAAVCRCIMYYAAVGPCFASTRVPMTQRWVLFLSFTFLPLIQSHKALWASHCLVMLQLWLLHHDHSCANETLPYQEVYGKVYGQFSHSSSAENLWVRAAMGDNLP
jgi:hypothetical protein